MTGLDFGIGSAHLDNQIIHHAVEESGTDAELVAMADGASDDPAQHVAAPFIAGNHTIGNQKGTGANMVGKNAQRWIFHIAAIRLPRRRTHQRLHQVNFVVAMHMLEHRRDALQPHAGVDAGLGQRMHHARFVAVELHEDVVPDFDVAITVFFRRTGPQGPVSPIIQKLSEA